MASVYESIGGNTTSRCLLAALPRPPAARGTAFPRPLTARCHRLTLTSQRPRLPTAFPDLSTAPFCSPPCSIGIRINTLVGGGSIAALSVSTPDSKFGCSDVEVPEHPFSPCSRPALTPHPAPTYTEHHCDRLMAGNGDLFACKTSDLL